MLILGLKLSQGLDVVEKARIDWIDLHNLLYYLPTMKCVNKMPAIVPMRVTNGDIVANITYWGALGWL